MAATRFSDIHDLGVIPPRPLELVDSNGERPVLMWPTDALSEEHRSLTGLAHDDIYAVPRRQVAPFDRSESLPTPEAEALESDARPFNVHAASVRYGQQ